MSEEEKVIPAKETVEKTSKKKTSAKKAVKVKKAPDKKILIGTILLALFILLVVAKVIDNRVYAKQLATLKSASPNGEYLFISWQPYNGAMGYNDRNPVETGGAIVMDGKFNFPSMRPGTQFNILSSTWKKFGNKKEGRTCLDAEGLDTWTSGNVPQEIQGQGPIKYVTFIGRSFLGANRIKNGYSVMNEDGTYRTYALGANRKVDIGKDKPVRGINGQDVFRWK